MKNFKISHILVFTGSLLFAGYLVFIGASYWKTSHKDKDHDIVDSQPTTMNNQRSSGSSKSSKLRPNIVYILADDLGYGDVGVYNKASKISTPNIDRLAQQGMIFTDAHSADAVCTPSRYGILTGDYGWRGSLKKGALGGYGKSIIEENSVTVAELLKQNGYSTAMSGKWHLGLDWAIKPEFQEAADSSKVQISDVGVVSQLDPDWVDFGRAPAGGPMDHGFDQTFILPASLDIPPYLLMRNDQVAEPPTSRTIGSQLNSGYTGAFWRAGRVAPGFDFLDTLPAFVRYAESFIRDSSVDSPFFLYLAFSSPHTPWMATPEFDGVSGAGGYGDFVAMTDAMVGRVIRVLDEAGVSDNTIVLLTSDNGPYWPDALADMYGHDATAGLRGMKADIWEGGHRIPFVVKWPGVVGEGTQSNSPIVQTNFLATVADILGVEHPKESGKDSVSMLGLLKGGEAISHPIVHHSARGYFAIRSGKWKLIDGLGSGGFTRPTFVEPESGIPPLQLYDMENDPQETTNLADKFPSLAENLLLELREIRGF
jgi:arylsulfatase A-like enzyme